eukprot:COSAG06_NODE_16076_length_1024_cov_0.802162_2_plen_62_part_00
MSNVSASERKRHLSPLTVVRQRLCPHLRDGEGDIIAAIDRAAGEPGAVAHRRDECFGVVLD